MASYSQDDMRVIPPGGWTRAGGAQLAVRVPGGALVDPITALQEVLAGYDIAATELRILEEVGPDGGAARFLVELHPVPDGD